MDKVEAKKIVEDYFQSWLDVPEIIYRTDEHYSIITDDLRLDIYPKGQRYHNVTKNIRGGFTNLHRMLVYFFPTSHK